MDVFVCGGTEVVGVAFIGIGAGQHVFGFTDFQHTTQGDEAKQYRPAPHVITVGATLGSRRYGLRVTLHLKRLKTFTLHQLGNLPFAS